jgi:hypothetical protein
MAKDDNFPVAANTQNVNWQTMHNDFAPVGTVPFPISYNDYWTNGQNVRRILVLGDTVIISTDINPDLTGPPPAVTTTRSYYQYSYDGGLTWLNDAISMSPSVATRWPNMAPIINSGSMTMTIAVTGHIYNTAQQGVTMVDAILGLGSFTITSTPAINYMDFFGYQKNATSLGGIISAPSGSATDSLFYYNFTYATNTYSGRKMIAPEIQASFRYSMVIADNGLNVYAAYWRSALANGLDIGIYNFESTDGGVTWGAGTPVGLPGPIGGDSISAWFGMDVIYKPGTTTRCLAFSTLAPGSLGTREGSKLLFWSPAVNGGNPTVICDYHKIPFMNDTSLFNNNFIGLQVGLTLLSHPSLGYSSDGTKLYCVFSAVQKDTSRLGGGLINYNYNDILACISTNNGATWSNPHSITNTMKRDELYPSISKSSNAGTTLNVIYSESGTPGSFTFTDNQIPDTVYTVFKRIPYFTIGVFQYSSEIPKEFRLYYNYPNPFNPTTRIRYALPRAGVVKLAVYDVMGREAETIVNKRQAAGSYEAVWDGTRFASGVYFYRLTAEGYGETRKMILIR